MLHTHSRLFSVLGLAILLGGFALAVPVASADGGPHRGAYSIYNVITGQTDTFEIGPGGGCAMDWKVGNGNWASLGGCLRPGYGFDIGRNADNHYELFAIGYDDQVWHNWQTQAGRGPWSGWYPFGGKVPNNLGSASFPGGPTVDSAGGRLTVTVYGTDFNRWARQQQCDNGCWDNWHRV